MVPNITLNNLAASAGRQGDKIAVSGSYGVYLAVAFSGAPVAGSWVECFWSSSNSNSVGVDNDGGSGVVGIDSAYYTAGTLDTYKMQLEWLGNLPITTDSAVIQKVHIGRLDVAAPYGMPIIINKTNVPFAAISGQYFSLIPL